MLRPGVWLLSGYCLGLLCGMYRQAALLPAAALFLAVLLIMIYHHKNDSWKILGVVAFFFLLGSLQSQFVFRPQRKDPQEEPIVIEGTVESRIGSGHTGEFICRLKGKTTCLVIETESLTEGDRIRAFGFLRPLPLPQNPGEWNQLIYYKARGVEYRFIPQNVQKRGTSVLLSLKRKLKEGLTHHLSELMPSEQMGVVLAILSGDRSSMDPDMKKAFQDAGIAHIIAISGLHIQIVAEMLEVLLKKVCRKRTALTCSMILIWFYCFLTGGAVSTLRAALNLTIRLIAVLIGRKDEKINTLAVSALILLILRPVRILDAGFQLSFMACLALYIGVLPWMRVFWIPRPVRKVIAPSFAAFSFTLPVVLFHFFSFCPYTVLLNLIVIPLMSIVIIMSFLAVGLSFLFEPAAKFLIGSVYYVLVFYQKLCEGVAKLPCASVTCGRPAIVFILAFYLFFGCWIVCSLSRDVQRKKKRLAKAGMLTAFLVCFLSVIQSAFHAESVLFSVGQGDCAVVRQNGKTFILDAGPGYDRVLKPYLQCRGIHTIDGIFLSHMDKDHSEGVMRLLEDPDFTVRCLYLPDNACHDFSALPSDHKKVLLSAGDSVRSGQLRFACCSPVKEFPYQDENSGSLCLHLVTKNGTIYMSGDSDIPAEQILLQRGEEWKSDVLKVGHHGSRTSTSEQLLEAVSPKFAFISCGAGNSYGHPHREVLDRLKEQNIQAWVSFETGALMMIDGRVISYREEYIKRWMSQAQWIS